MCSNYKAVTDVTRFRQYFEVDRDDRPTAPETWPLGLAPFIRLVDGARVVDDGLFGLLPHFAKELIYGRRTYNARTETVDKLPSFRESWAKGWRCIVPAEIVYEPNYESGKAVRWAIQHAARIPMGIAGIYRQWINKVDGELRWTFAMLTVSGEGHPVYQRMHKPGDEKRMVLILEPADFDRWLGCTPDEARTFFRQYSGPLVATPAPLAVRERKTRT